MEFFISVRELVSLAEEGRNGKYKAAKMLDMLSLEETEDYIIELVNLLERILEIDEEQLKDIASNKIIKLSQRMNEEAIINLCEGLLNSQNPYLKYLSGLILLRNIDKVDKDIAKEYAIRLLMVADEDLYNLGVAIIKELEKQLSKDDIMEIMETILKSRTKKGIGGLILLLSIVGKKLTFEEIVNYISYALENADKNEIENIKHDLSLLKGIIGKKNYKRLLEHLGILDSLNNRKK